jgi:hypothetical protein
MPAMALLLAHVLPFRSNPELIHLPSFEPRGSVVEYPQDGQQTIAQSLCSTQLEHARLASGLNWWPHRGQVKSVSTVITTLIP